MPLLSLAWHLGFVLKPGLYVCPGNPDICDQSVKVRVSTTPGRPSLSGLTVEYVGYCGSMGPYSYPCDETRCGDGNAEFILTGPESYRWRNLGHPFQCDFVRKR